MRYSRRLPTLLLRDPPDYEYSPDTLSVIIRNFSEARRIEHVDESIMYLAENYRPKMLKKVMQHFCRIHRDIIPTLFVIGDLESLKWLYSIGGGLGEGVGVDVGYSHLAYEHWDVLDWYMDRLSIYRDRAEVAIYSISLAGANWCMSRRHFRVVSIDRSVAINVAMRTGILNLEHLLAPGEKFSFHEIWDTLKSALYKTSVPEDLNKHLPYWDTIFPDIAKHMDWKSWGPDPLEKFEYVLPSNAGGQAIFRILERDFTNNGCPTPKDRINDVW